MIVIAVFCLLVASVKSASFCASQTDFNQSPINIEFQSVIVDDFLVDPIRLTCPEQAAVEVVYAGHDLSSRNAVILGYPPEGNVTNLHVGIEEDFWAEVGEFRFNGGSPEFRTADFRLAQFHIHEPSEHTIDGRPFPMEMHMVHLNHALKETTCAEQCERPSPEDGEDPAEATNTCKSCISTDPNGVLVLAVLFDSGEPNEFVQSILNYIEDPETQDKMAQKEELSTTLDIDVFKHLFPSEEFSNFWYYEGSTTTPPCLYAHWFISQGYRTVSVEQIFKLKQYLTHSENHRLIQPLNGRPVKSAMRTADDYYDTAFEDGQQCGLKNKCETVCVADEYKDGYEIEES